MKEKTSKMQHNYKKGLKSALAMILSIALALGAWPAAQVQMGIGGTANAAPAVMDAVADDATADYWAQLNYDAVEGRTTKNEGRIWTDKSVYTGDAVVLSDDNTTMTVEKGTDSNFLVGLSALSSTMSVEGVSERPLDIVLVLDVSGSMEERMYKTVYANEMTANGTYYIYRNNDYVQLFYSRNQGSWYYRTGNNNTIWVTPKTSATSSGTQVYSTITKMESLEASVNGLVDSTVKVNKTITDADKQHRIALVKFSGNISNTVGNTTYVSDRYTYNHSQIVRNFEIITESNVDSFKNTVAALSPAGATRADNGLDRAREALKSARDDAQQVVIFFTDGVPTTFQDWSASVANTAIGTAKEMKDDGAWIYSIGVFASADPTGDGALNRYMNAVSSNYPNATGYTTRTMGNRGSGDYYKTAANSDELEAIFESIATEISGKTASVPTHVEDGYDASKGGYVTFVDKLGDYMEVKAFDSVVYNGVEYENQLTDSEWDAADASTDVFVSSVIVKNDLGEDVEIGSIVATIERSDSARVGDIITVRIPAALIPLTYYDVVVEDGLATTKRIPTTPIRAFYEVGLKEETRFLMAAPDADMRDYMSTHTSDDGQVVFYSNAYDASSNATNGSTVASYLPAKTNSMYFAVVDTPIYADAACTTPVTRYNPNTTYYYQRDYYVVGEGLEPQKEVIAFPSSVLSQVTYDFSGEGGQLVVKAGNGRYTRADASNTVKAAGANKTSTAANVATPIWETWTTGTSPVTVFLGNNGRLEVTPEVFKTVSGEHVQNAGTSDEVKITLSDGSTVRIGDVLTYTIRAINTEDTEATVKVTDTVPAGTEYVEGSADNGGVYANGVITWTLTGVAADDEREVSFQVKVTEAILEAGFTTVNNTAYVSVNDNPAYATNTTTNPPSGKTVEGTSAGVDLTDGVKVGDELTYYITYANDTDHATTVTVSDIIPAGTTYMANSASHGGVYDPEDKTIVWTLDNVQPGFVGTVSFRVVVDASAKTPIENDAAIQVGPNNPNVDTNPTEVKVKTTDLQLKKTVELPDNYDDAAALERFNTEFALTLKEITGNLSGEYTLMRNGAEDNSKLEFVSGIATVKIKHGETLEIQGLPVGAVISVVETAVAGYTPAYSGLSDVGTITLADNSENVGSTTANVNTVTVTNTYAITPAPFQLSGTKTITSETWIPDLTFTFTSQECDEHGNVKENGQLVTATASVNNADKTVDFSFSPRSFEKAGTSYFLITETASGVNGVVYDEVQYLLEIVVSDDGKGVLSTDMTIKSRDNANGSFTAYAAAEDAKVVFENRYVPTETQLILEASKILNNMPLTDGMFSFEAYVKGDAQKTPVTSGQNNADGTITFRPITYKPSDLGNAGSKTITYVITEVNSGMAGVKYDTSEYEVTVTLTNNNGRLKADAAYPQNGIIFENEYDPGEESVTLEAKKVLSGEARTLKAGEFSFEVKDAAGDVVATGTNDADGNVTFGAIGYTLEDLGGAASKEFAYTISEIKPDVSFDPFVEYSTVQYTAKVTVSYDSASGTLNVSEPVYSLNDNTVNAMTFTNNVNKNYVEIIPNAMTKATTGNNVPSTATFSFSILDMDGKIVGTGVGSANGEINFSTLSFDRVGEYNFWIQETNAGSTVVNGITYDSTRYLLKVTVTYDGTNSELVATQKYLALKANGDKNTVTDYTEPLTAPHFNNTYEAKGSATVSATKSFTFADGTQIPLSEGEFAFKLTRLDANGNATDKVTNGYMHDTGTIEFASLYYTNADIPENSSTAVIKYKMEEIAPAEANKIPGVSYTDAVYYAAVTLTLNNETITTDVKYYTDAECTKEYTANAVPVFFNTYKPVENTSTKIQVTKKLTGRTLTAGEFSFELVHIKADNSSQVVEVATNDANGVVEFVRTYYAATWPAGQKSMEIKYLIREVAGNLRGVEYDPQVFGVKLTVVDDGTGKLSVDPNSITYYKGDTFTDVISNAEVVFENKYTAQGTSYTPVAEKKLTGRTMTDNEFAFEVRLFDLATGAIGDLRSTGLSKADGSVVFTPMGYNDRPGTNEVTVTYIISEIAGNMGGVTYDPNPYYLAVTLKDDGAGSIEVVSARYYTGYDAAKKELTEAVNTITFNNTYVPTDAFVNLVATKELEGRELAADEFDFVVKDKSTGEVVTYGKNDKEGKITFGTISYTQADLGGVLEKEFTYTISEIKPSDADRTGITADTATFDVTVKVTDDGNGKLSADVTYPTGGVVFKNKYNPKSVKVAFTALKTLLDKKLEADEFVFEVRDADDNVVAFGTNDESGVVTFAPFIFDAPGEYTYTVRELKDRTTTSDSINADGSINKAGSYDFDASVYTVKVVVTDDYTGQLKAAVTYYKDGTADANKVDTINFVNEYTRGDLVNVNLSTTIKAKKTVTAPEGIDYKLSKGDFKFTVYDIRNNVISTGENEADGTIDFEPFEFETAGLYRYWIVEDTTTKPGITNDSRAWELHIQVHYDVETGKLYINPEDVLTFPIQRAADVEEVPVFVNTYNPAPAEASVTVTKNLIGRPLNGSEFIFTLYEVVDGNEVPITEARNDADGNVNFAFEIDTVGTHTYKVTEWIPEEGDVGITYDQTAVEDIQIQVSNDQTTGKLVADQASMPNDSTFDNIYTPGEVSVIIEADKVVETSGNTEYVLDGGEFTFHLLDSKNKVVAEAKNDEGGVVQFKLTYTDDMLEGEDEKTFAYTIKEVVPAKKDRISGMTYDENGYKVSVTVKDDYAGALKVVVNYEDDKIPVITNTYKAEPVIAVVEANKVFEGKKLRKNAFTFELVDADGKVLAEAKNNAKGEIEFKLEFANSGEYTFTIREKAGDDADVIYDTSIHTVVVTVTDNQNGQLEAKVSYENDKAPTFVNIYDKEKDTPQTGDDSPISGVMIMMIVSLAAILGILGYKGQMSKYRRKRR